MTDAPLLVLTGSTASGKESVATLVAHRLAPPAVAEIVCADSVKPYRGLAIAAAAPPASSRALVPHHLVAILDPAERLDVRRWCELAQAAIDDIRGRGRVPLIVGGTALYLRSLLFGLFDGPPQDAALRARLTAEEAAEPGTLHARLAVVDPVSAERLHPHDLKRLLRALEVHELTGSPLSALLGQWEGPPRIPYVAVGLRRTPEDLRRRIDARVDRMMAAGLLDEVRALAGPGRLGATAAEAIGVKELLPVVAARAPDGAPEVAGQDGTPDPAALAAAVALIKHSTWTFARRQATWWRRFPGVEWLDVAAGEPPESVAERVASHFGRAIASKTA